MRDRNASIAMATVFALWCVVIAALFLAGFLSTPVNVPARRAEVFGRNDTLFVCDHGECRFVDPTWTRCPRRSR